MILGFQGFPGLHQINVARGNCFKQSHHSQITKGAAFANWLGHKALTVVSLPANTVGAGVGSLGAIVTGCTLGALKVSIYAVTLGNVKPSFPSGFFWNAERGFNAGAHVAVNLGELLYDAGNTVYLGYRAIRWVAQKLHLEGLFTAIFRQLSEAFKFITNEIVAPVFRFVGRRIEKGFEKAAQAEGNFNFKGETPALLKPLDDLAKDNRIDFSANDRPLINIFKHYLFSIPNIPVNVAAAVGAGAASVVLGTAFVSKAALYATTNIDIPVPTFAGQALDATLATTRNVGVDVGTNIGDGFVLLYKTANALGINRVVATAIQIIMYIPEAILS